MTQVLKLEFSKLAVGTSFTFSRFPSFIYVKDSDSTASLAGSSSLIGRFTDLDESDLVHPVWLSEGASSLEDVDSDSVTSV